MEKADNTSVSFRYDASGNRIAKIASGDTTVYVRDASGNVMGVYKNDTLIEQSIYGSSRLGLLTQASKTGYRTLGGKKYELSNHLGNVLAVVSDNINLDQDSTWASVVNVTDYYPFGLAMEGRSLQDSAYRYGFNGKELDGGGEWGGQNNYDYGFRIYNPSIAKFLSVDPLTGSYPWYTPYQFAGNKPIRFIDLDGLEEYDPMQDPFFVAKLVKTTFYDVKHSIYNASAAMNGGKFRARYKVDGNDNQVFETEYYSREETGLGDYFTNTLLDGLDVVNVLFFGKLDPTDFLGAKTGAKNQSITAIKSGIGEYKEVGGHHVHAKAAFQNHFTYDPNKGFSISQAFMKANGLDHIEMTRTQRRLFDELSESGRPNTLEEHSRIAREALIAGGAGEEMADGLVNQSILNLKNQKVEQPTKIPWNKNNE